MLRGKEKSSLRIYSLQESVRHGAPFFVKRDTKTPGSGRQHSPIIRSEYAQLENSIYIKGRYIRQSLHTTQNVPRGLVVSITIHYYSHTVVFITLNTIYYGYLFYKETPINYLLFMDDLKLYGKAELELQSLVHAVWITSKDIGMEFEMGKFGTVLIKKEKICDMEDIEMPDGQQMKWL